VLVSMIATLVIGCCSYQQNASIKPDQTMIMESDFETQSFHKIHEQLNKCMRRMREDKMVMEQMQE
jgi:uncharacterized protein YcfL